MEQLQEDASGKPACIQDPNKVAFPLPAAANPWVAKPVDSAGADGVQQESSQMLAQLQKADGHLDDSTASLYGEPGSGDDAMPVDSWMQSLKSNEEFLLHYFQACFSRQDASRPQRSELDRVPPPAPPHPHESSPELRAQCWEDCSECKGWEAHPLWCVSDVSSDTDWSEISTVFSQTLRSDSGGSDATFSGTDVSLLDGPAWDFCPGPLLDSEDHKEWLQQRSRRRTAPRKERSSKKKLLAARHMDENSQLGRFLRANAQAAQELAALAAGDAPSNVQRPCETPPEVKALVQAKSWKELKAEAMEKASSIHQSLGSEFKEIPATWDFRRGNGSKACKPQLQQSKHEGSSPTKCAGVPSRSSVDSPLATREVLLTPKMLTNAKLRQVSAVFIAAMERSADEISRMASMTEAVSRQARAASPETQRLLLGKSKRELLADSMHKAESMAFRNPQSLPYDWSVRSRSQRGGSCVHWAAVRRAGEHFGAGHAETAPSELQQAQPADHNLVEDRNFHCFLSWSVPKRHLWLRQVRGAFEGTVQPGSSCTTGHKRVEKALPHAHDLRWTLALSKLEVRQVTQTGVSIPASSADCDASLSMEWAATFAACSRAFFGPGRLLTVDVLANAMEAEGVPVELSDLDFGPSSRRCLKAGLQATSRAGHDISLQVCTSPPNSPVRAQHEACGVIALETSLPECMGNLRLELQFQLPSTDASALACLLDDAGSTFRKVVRKYPHEKGNNAGIDVCGCFVHPELQVFSVAMKKSKMTDSCLTGLLNALRMELQRAFPERFFQTSDESNCLEAVV